MRDFTDEEKALFEADADEAERGYDIDYLRARVKAGRPPLDEDGAVIVQFRLPRRVLKDLDARAQAQSTTRSDLLRSAVDGLLAA